MENNPPYYTLTKWLLYMIATLNWRCKTVQKPYTSQNGAVKPACTPLTVLLQTFYLV